MILWWNLVFVQEHTLNAEVFTIQNEMIYCSSVISFSSHTRQLNSWKNTDCANDLNLGRVVFPWAIAFIIDLCARNFWNIPHANLVKMTLLHAVCRHYITKITLMFTKVAVTMKYCFGWVYQFRLVQGKTSHPRGGNCL